MGSGWTDRQTLRELLTERHVLGQNRDGQKCSGTEIFGGTEVINPGAMLSRLLQLKIQIFDILNKLNEGAIYSEYVKIFPVET